MKKADTVSPGWNEAAERSNVPPTTVSPGERPTSSRNMWVLVRAAFTSCAQVATSTAPLRGT